MICHQCEQRFFGPDSLKELERDNCSIGISLPEAIKIIDDDLFCTICSTILQDVATALAAHIAQPDEGGKAHWQETARTIEKWPEFRARIEKRIGRYSLLIGPCYQAAIKVKDRPLLKLDLNTRLFILSPRTGEAECNLALYVETRLTSY